ncbi:MAG: bifunctional folylpolyglutamate synthase/dihydrofolate synthase [Spirochaetales bacterium]|nr:bifunctional folylpolyglutamate synthase/dihydrofolate synthase [Spirochaetales bacterium]
MRFEEIWPWLESQTNLEKTPDATPRVWRLDRMHALLEIFGHPERIRPTFHIAGSKGKGSTAGFLSSILSAAGFEPGLYISPHLVDWRERITKNGVFFSQESYLEAFTSLKNLWLDQDQLVRFARTWGGTPTTFELLTLGAFLVFQAEQCSAQVLETGLGGRLDATNVCQPDVCLLTLIEYEHTEILGTTLEQIATEKAGILKQGVPAVVASQPPQAWNVFQKTSEEKSVPLLLWSDALQHFETKLSSAGTDLSVTLTNGNIWASRLPLLGRHQGENAVLAALAVDTWAAQHQMLPQNGKTWAEAISHGWANVRLSGRMEVIRTNPLVVVDGAHTVQSALAAATTWVEIFHRGGTLLFGAFEGKNIEGMASALAGIFDRVILCPPGNERPSSTDHMRQTFLSAGYSASQITTHSSPDVAWLNAQKENAPLLVLGSFYLVGKISLWSRGHS